MIRNKAKKIAAFAIAAMMAAAITPAMAAPSFASEENIEPIATGAEVAAEEADEEVAEEYQDAEATIEEADEEVAEESQDAEEYQQDDVFSAKGGISAKAATSPSQAQTLSFGQMVSGRFTGYLEPVINGSRYYMDRTIHYYKFRTGNTAGASYVVKAEYSRYGGDSPNDIEKVLLYDRNYNLVEFSSVSPAERAWRSNYGQCNESMRLRAYEAGNLTYKSLNPNQDYYIAVQCEAGPYCSYIDYRVGVETNGSTSSTPSLRTPTLTVDKTNIVTKDKNNVYVTGTVSCAVGQFVGVYAPDSNLMYNYVQLSNTNGRVSFRLQVPSRYLNDGTQSFTVKSLPLKNIINTSNSIRINVTIGDAVSNTNNQNHTTFYPIYKVTVNGSVYEVLQNKQIGGPAARLVKAKNAKSVTIPSMIKYKGVHYCVTGIQPNAFKSSNATKVTIKTIKFSKSSVRSCMAGSKVKTVKVKAENKKLSKSIAKKYKKFFTKGNCGKKVKVK